MIARCDDLCFHTNQNSTVQISFTFDNSQDSLLVVCWAGALIAVMTRAIFRLTVLISPSSFLRVPLAAPDLNLDSSDLRSLSRLINSSCDNFDNSSVSSRFICFFFLFARGCLSRGPWARILLYCLSFRYLRTFSVYWSFCGRSSVL